MKIPTQLLVALAALVALASPAAAQSASPQVLESLRAHFPSEAAALAERLAGKSPDAARETLGEAMEKFHRDHLREILAAPGERLIALETRHAAMLRALGARDVHLCAIVGNLGFFSSEARGAAPIEGIDDYAVTLIELAAAGRGRAAPRALARGDVEAWLAIAERREPRIPVRSILMDRAARASAGDENLCFGAALLHEAATLLPRERAEVMSAILAGALLGTD